MSDDEIPPPPREFLPGTPPLSWRRPHRRDAMYVKFADFMADGLFDPGAQMRIRVGSRTIEASVERDGYIRIAHLGRFRTPSAAMRALTGSPSGAYDAWQVWIGTRWAFVREVEGAYREGRPLDQ